MKTGTWMACLACGVAGFVLSGLWQSQSNGQDKPSPNLAITMWEYRIEYRMSEDKLNKFGSEGWELVAVACKGRGDIDTTLYLKRQKQTVNHPVQKPDAKSESN